MTFDGHILQFKTKKHIKMADQDNKRPIRIIQIKLINFQQKKKYNRIHYQSYQTMKYNNHGA